MQMHFSVDGKEDYIHVYEAVWKPGWAPIDAGPRLTRDMTITLTSAEAIHLPT